MNTLRRVWLVFSLEDALYLVAARGRLMQQLPEGSMLAVSLPEQEIQVLLTGRLCLAASNTQAQCVVSGPTVEIDALEQELKSRDLDCRRLRTSHAFHSSMVEPVLEEFVTLVRSLKLHSPEIPYISNVTGTRLLLSRQPTLAIGERIYVSKFFSPVALQKSYRNPPPFC